MRKSTGIILLFVCIAAILIAGCTTPAPVNTTERIVYVTVLATPTPEPPANLQNNPSAIAPAPTQSPTPRPAVTSDPSKYVQTSSARTDGDSGDSGDPPINWGNRARAVYTKETELIVAGIKIPIRPQI